MILRPETKADAAAIRQLTEDAFRPKAFSDGTEGRVIDDLRAAVALAISTVAVKGDDIVGHVAFSAATVGDEAGWYTLGPVAVRADLQRHGIGTQLIEDGLARLRAMGARGSVLTGDPRYYSRFGYRNYETLTFGGVPDRHLQALSLSGEIPTGEVRFHPAFGDTI